MKIRYDPAGDILLITLKEKPLAYGEGITPQIIAHYSKDNELVEMEVIDASELFSKKKEIYVPEYIKQKAAHIQRSLSGAVAGSIVCAAALQSADINHLQPTSPAETSRSHKS